MSHIQQYNENGGSANEDAMKVIDRYHLDSLKNKKTQAKATCQRTKTNGTNGFWSTIKKTREALQQIDDAQQVALEIMGEIADKYKSCNDLKNVQKVTGEMEDIEEITTKVTESILGFILSPGILGFKKRWSIKYCNNRLINKKINNN